MIECEFNTIFRFRSQCTKTSTPSSSPQVKEKVIEQAWTNLTVAAANGNTSLLVKPLSANDCEHSDWCVGVERRGVRPNMTTPGRCVCRV